MSGRRLRRTACGSLLPAAAGSQRTGSQSDSCNAACGHSHTKEPRGSIVPASKPAQRDVKVGDSAPCLATVAMCHAREPAHMHAGAGTNVNLSTAERKVGQCMNISSHIT